MRNADRHPISACAVGGGEAQGVETVAAVWRRQHGKIGFAAHVGRRRGVAVEAEQQRGEQKQEAGGHGWGGRLKEVEKRVEYLYPTYV